MITLSTPGAISQLAAIKASMLDGGSGSTRKRYQASSEPSKPQPFSPAFCTSSPNCMLK